MSDRVKYLSTENESFGFLFSDRNGVVVPCKRGGPGAKCGIPCGSSVMIEGYSGTGKTIFALNLCGCSLRQGEYAVVYSLDQSASEVQDVFGWTPLQL